MDKQNITNTGVKHIVDGKNYVVYHDTTLKNPLAGFFIKIDDMSGGKKQKLKLSDMTKNKSEKLISTLKNKAKPPPGMKLNPETGRFIKIGGPTNLKLNPKTFKDPISLATVKKTDGIKLNKTWYGRAGLRNWINSGKNTIPHSRRTFTEPEINSIFIGKNGQKIPRKNVNVNNSNNTNSNRNNNNRNLTLEYDYADDYSTVQTGGQKTFATFADFKEYINNLESEMTSEEIGGIEDLEIKITDRPGAVIKMDVKRMALLDAGGDVLNGWIDISFDITRGGQHTSVSATDMRHVTPRGLLRNLDTAIS